MNGNRKERNKRENRETRENQECEQKVQNEPPAKKINRLMQKIPKEKRARLEQEERTNDGKNCKKLNQIYEN